MKDAYYFRHDSNAHNDPKMLALRIKEGWEGIGLYWTFLEILRDLPDYKYPLNNDYIKEIELRLSHPQASLEAWVKACIEIGLLVQKDGFLYSESFLRRMEEIDERRRVLSESGRRGGIKSSQAQARLKPPSSSKVKESKVNKIKEKPISTPVEKESTVEARDFFYLKYKETVGKEYVPDFAKDGKIFKDLLKATPIGEIKSAVEAFFKSEDEFIQQAGFTVGVFRTQVNKLRQVKHGGLPAHLRPFIRKE